MRANYEHVCGSLGSLALVCSLFSAPARAADPAPSGAPLRQPAAAVSKPPDAAATRTPPVISPFDRRAGVAAEIGHSGGGPFRQVPGGDAVLVGCEITLFQYGQSAVIIKSIKPIFELPDGSRKDGPPQGDPTRWTIRVEAEKGYAVGKMAGRFGERIDGFYFVFMRRHGNGLDENDQYPSRWLGSRGGGGLTEVANPKLRPAIGLGGRCGADVDALSLIFE